MRAIRELPLAASLLLTGFALFFGDGPGNGSLPWLGGGALLAIVALVAAVGVPAGWPRLVPLGLLAAWLALSISWSALPDRSWDYANRTFVYVLFAALGLWVATRTRELALGLMVLLGAVIVWSLLGKVLPFVYDYGSLQVGRLRGPIGLWNQLALATVFALPLALWRRKLEGTLLAYASIVALLLTYSRGGVITAVLVVCAWFLLDDDASEGARTLLSAAVPAAIVVGIAFALPGVTGDGQSSHVRWRDGLIFGVLLVAGADAARLLRRVPLPRVPRRILVSAGIAVLLALAAVVIVRGGGSGIPGNGAGHLGSTSSNFRLTWWKQAWKGWEHAMLAGTGAGSFHVTNLRYRGSFLDFTTEPHDLPLQFLSEAGVVGLAILLVAVAFLFQRRRGGHELALALLLPAYLVHSLVDIDWDFVAVSAPAFLAAGALVGRPAVRTVSPFGALVAAGAALLAFGVLLLPWLGERWAADASTASPARAVTLANRARSVDPLLIDPLWALALASELRGNLPQALRYYDKATRKQPQNPQTWLVAGQFALRNGCPRAAYTYLLQFVERDNKARPSDGADDYRRALALVNTGKPRC